MEHLFHAIEIEAREIGAFKHVVQVAHAVDGGVDGSERVVAAEKEFVPDAVFLDEHQRMVVLKRTVVEGGAIGVDVAVLADGGDALAFVRMAEMGENQADFREARGDLVEMAGKGEFERGLRDERRAGMEEHREVVTGGVGPEVVELPVLRVEAGVHRHQLNAL